LAPRAHESAAPAMSATVIVAFSFTAYLPQVVTHRYR